jgi:glycosyltransferase involved in cell wall biosynthesis
VKIAIMMRAMDQDTGFRVYVERLVDTLLQIDHKNTYLLLYRTTKWIGRFSSIQNVKEILLPNHHKFIWDQIVVPFRAWREGADIVYNPKFSVPLISHCPVAMGLSEPSWWAWPQHHPRWDVWYMKAMLPLYCRKAAHIFPLSNFILQENRKYLSLPLENATVTYSANNLHFRSIEDPVYLEKFRKKYDLPENFILSVTRVENIGNQKTSFSATKNVETTIRAYAECRKYLPHKLVIAGSHIREYLLSTGWQNADLQGVCFVGFIPHEDLAALFNLADLFVMPSFYEGFGFVLVEAMACGCPVIASQAGACPEVSGGAALLADPHDPSDFSKKIFSVLRDESLRQGLKKKGLERAMFFSWERTARLTLEGLTRAVTDSRRKR